MWHIRMREVSNFSTILGTCFDCISVYYFDQELLKMMDILFYAVICLNLTMFALLIALFVFFTHIFMV